MGFPFSTTVYKGYNAGTGISGGIWHDIPKELVWGDNNEGVFIGDDFLDVTSTVASNVGKLQGTRSYTTREDNSCTILPLATDHNGVLQLLTDGTDNQEVYGEVGGATGVHCLYSDTAGSAYPFWFECRVSFLNITDTTASAFIGLGEEGFAVADALSDADALADKDFLGFFRVGADGDQLDTITRINGTAVQTIKANAFDGSATPSGTVPSAVVADTYNKLGMKYVPQNPDGARLEYYIDGLLLPDVVEGNPIPSTAPDGEQLKFVYGFKNSTGAIFSMNFDWWYFAQSRCPETSI